MPRNSQPKIQIDRCCRRGRTTRHEKCQFPSPGLLVVGYNRPKPGSFRKGSMNSQRTTRCHRIAPILQNDAGNPKDECPDCEAIVTWLARVSSLPSHPQSQGYCPPSLPDALSNFSIAPIKTPSTSGATWLARLLASYPPCV